MTLLTIIAIVYVLSALIVGPIHWAQYQDEKKNDNIRMEDKVMSLYVVPFCPVMNTVVAFCIIINYLERM